MGRSGRWRRSVGVLLVAALVALGVPGAMVGMASPAGAVGTASMAGTVTAGGSPLAYADLTIDRLDGGIWQTETWSSTDDVGQYLVTGLDAGTYRVQASVWDGTQVSTYHPSAFWGDDAASVAVAAGAAVTGIDIAMINGGQLTVSTTGSVVAWATVRVFDDLDREVAVGSVDTWSPQWSGTLPAGGYRILIEGDDWSPTFAATWFGDSRLRSGATVATVTDDAETTAEVGVLPLGDQVVTIVVDPEGAPVSGVQVGAFPYTSMALTDVYGEALVGGIVDESTPVVAVPPAASGFTSATLNYVKAGTRVTLSLQALQAGITGTVTGDLGAPLGGIVVCANTEYYAGYVVDTPCGPEDVSTITAADGTYALPITGVPTKITVRFHDPSGSYASEARPQAVAVGVAAVVPGIDAVLGRAGQVTGTLTDDDGAGAPGVSIVVEALPPADGFRSRTVSGVDGAWSIGHLPAGSYRVFFEPADGSPLLEEYYDDALTDTAATPVVVVAETSTPGIDAVLAAGSAISGTVLLPDGSPASGATVRARVDDPYGYSGWFSASTGPDGRYLIGGLRTGTYLVEFEDLYVWTGTGQDVAFGSFYDGATSAGAATRIPVPEGEEVLDINGQLLAGAQVSGTLTGPSGAPLASATVIVTSEDPFGISYTGEVGRAVTAADGTWTVSDIGPGSYYLGFRPLQRVVQAEVWNDVPTVLGATKLNLVAGDVVGGFDAQLAWGGVIEGTITDDLGVPVDGNYVDYNLVVRAHDAYSGEPISTSSVKADGTYALANLPSGTYLVEFGKRYDSGDLRVGTEWYDDAPDQARAQMVTVNASQTVSGIDAELDRLGTVTGTILNANGSPAVSLRVQAYPVGSNSDYLRYDDMYTYTGGNGAYTIPDLPPGEYYVRIGGDGAAYEYYDDAFVEGDATPVTVLAGQTTSSIDIGREAAGSISGRVTDTAGTPRASVKVEVIGNGGYGGSLSTITAPDGTYSVGGLRPGDYRVRFVPPGPYLQARFHGGATQAYQATPVSVGLDAAVSGIDGVLPGAGRLTGVISDPAAQPVAGSWINAIGPDGAYASDQVGIDGVYDLPNLAPGAYKLAVYPPSGMNLYPEWYLNAASEATATPISVNAGASSTADVALDAGLRITGTVVDPDGNPVADAQVSAHSDAGEASQYASGVTDVDGHYEIVGLRAGAFSVVASPPWPSNLVASDPSLVTVDSDEVVDLAVRAGATIEGTVIDAGGAPLASANVRVHREGDEWYSASAYTQADGSYRVIRMVPGTYTVSFQPPDYSSVEWYDEVATRAEATPIVVVEGATVSSIDAQLGSSPTSTGSISGLLTDPTGAPLPNASVSAIPTGSSGSTGWVTTGADGTYTIDLEPGSYRLRFLASIDGVLSWEWYDDTTLAALATPVVVADVPVTGIDAALAIGGALSGRVAGSGGVVRLTSLDGVPVDPTISGTSISSTGRWSMQNVPPGQYLLEADSNDAIPTQFVPGTFSPAAATVVTVTPRSYQTGLDITTPRPGGSITGRVTGDGGAGLASYQVSAALIGDDSPWADAWGTTDADGYYTISGVTPGSYQVGFARCEWQYCDPIAQYYDNSPTPDGATPVVVTDGTATSGIDADLSTSLALGPPTNLVATPGNGQVTLTWGAPVSDGGSPITGYTVTTHPGGATLAIGAGVLTATIVGLTNGTPYSFSVTATTAEATSPAADSSIVTPATVPGAPTAVNAVANDGGLAVSWTAPVGNGGSALTGYVLSTTPATSAFPVAAGTTATTLSGLTNGTAYTVSVRAINVIGEGPAGQSASATPVGLPGAPTGVSAEPANRQGQVTWTAPAVTGGIITGYKVTAAPGGATVTVAGNVTSAAVTGLTNGSSYTFTVKAITAAGAGPASEPSPAITPATLPAAPTGLAVAPAATTADASWTAPTDMGGSALLRYEVSAQPRTGAAVVLDVTAPQTTGKVTGLVSGSDYTFRVRAVTAIGAGPWSAAVGPMQVGFDDVPASSPFAEDIAWMADQGITGGYADGTFKPGAFITRMAMAAFLYRMAGSPNGPDPACTAPAFGDVPVSHPFCGEVAWMLAEGITSPGATYRPTAPVSRQAMAAFLWRLAGEPAGPFPDPHFPDVPAGHPFQTAVWWMAQSGITGGYSDHTYRPAGPVSRQAMAAFLHRYVVAGYSVG